LGQLKHSKRTKEEKEDDNIVISEVDNPKAWEKSVAIELVKFKALTKDVSELFRPGKIDPVFQPMTLNEVKEAVREMDPILKDDSETFRAAVFLLSTLSVGVRMHKLAKFTGYYWKDVRRWNKNARDNGVFRYGKIFHSGWDEEETGFIGFWLDVLVLQGEIQMVD